MLIFLLPLVNALLKENVLLPFPVTMNDNVIQSSLTLDANWRWNHFKSGSNNCYDGSWKCADPVKCYNDCMLEGVPKEDWDVPYGVKVNKNSVSLQYVTKGPYGTNVGSRLYVVNNKDYVKFSLLNQEFSFTVDISQIECGMNAALYLVDMNGIPDLGGAEFGTGYQDAQCPYDIKYFNGFYNLNGTGACGAEMDIWEANKYASAFTPHNCLKSGKCISDKDCGKSDRYSGYCDKDGADYNSFRLGVKNLYGPGLKVDTLKPFQVKMQFITTSGVLTKIKRQFVQNNVVFDAGELTDASININKSLFKEKNYFNTLGGLQKMGESLKNGMVLVLSLWDDTSSKMAWLDGTYPVGSSIAGALRGPCPPDKRDPTYLRATYPNAKVIFSDIKSGPIPSIPSPSVAPIPIPVGCQLEKPCQNIMVTCAD